MTITPVEAWSLTCKRCDSLVARHTQLWFLLENATAVHLTLDKTLLYDEQLEAHPHDVNGSWRVYSHEGVVPALEFVKIRSTDLRKRERLPFELCCWKCDAKVASEGVLDELPGEPMLLLDSKACACVLDREQLYGVAGGNKARKWGVILRQLQAMGLPLKIRKLQDLVRVETIGNAPTTQVVPVVHPTETSIRRWFTPRAKMSSL